MKTIRLTSIVAVCAAAALLSGCVVAPIGVRPVAVRPVYVEPAPVVVIPAPVPYYYGYRGRYRNWH